MPAKADNKAAALTRSIRRVERLAGAWGFLCGERAEPFDEWPLVGLSLVSASSAVKSLMLSTLPIVVPFPQDEASRSVCGFHPCSHAPRGNTRDATLCVVGVRNHWNIKMLRWRTRSVRHLRSHGDRGNEERCYTQVGVCATSRRDGR